MRKKWSNPHYTQEYWIPYKSTELKPVNKSIQFKTNHIDISSYKY